MTPVSQAIREIPVSRDGLVPEGYGDEVSLLLNGAIDQPETQKEPYDGDDPNFTNTPAEFDFRFGGFR